MAPSAKPSRNTIKEVKIGFVANRRSISDKLAMYPVNQTNMASNNEANSQVFQFEVVMRPQTSRQSNGSTSREAKILLKVPRQRMNQEIKRIIRSGGRIMSIKPLVAKEVENQVVEQASFPWWVEISTTQPRCLYYFGPFDSQEEAQTNQGGYIEDLLAEGAQGINVNLKQCQPQTLTQEWDV